MQNFPRSRILTSSKTKTMIGYESYIGYDLFFTALSHGYLVTVQPSQNGPAAGSTSRLLWEFDRLHCYIK